MTLKTIILVLSTIIYGFALKFYGFVDMNSMLSIWVLTYGCHLVINTYIIESFLLGDTENIQMRFYTVSIFSLLFCYILPYAFIPISVIVLFYLYSLNTKSLFTPTFQQHIQQQQAQQQPLERREVSRQVMNQLNSLRNDIKLMELKGFTVLHFESVNSLIKAYIEGVDANVIKSNINIASMQYSDLSRMININENIDDYEVVCRLRDIATIFNNEI